MHNLAASSGGSSLEGGIILLLIVGGIIAAATQTGRDTVRRAGRAVNRAGRTRVGPNPRSKAGQSLIGTRTDKQPRR